MLGINRRETGLGLAVLTVFVLLYLTYLSSDRQAQQVLEDERRQAGLAARSLEAASHLQDVHRGVESYLLTRSETDLPKLNTSLEQLNDALADVAKVESSAFMTSIRGQVANYENSALRVISLRQVLGINHNTGVEGRLRDAVHAVETLLAEAGREDLLVDLLMMRRHEKDFMMRRSQGYIQKFNTRFSLFEKKLSQSRLPGSDKQRISELMDVYFEGFQEWAAICYQMSEEIDASNDVYNRIVALIGSITSRQIADAQLKSRRRASVENQNNLLLLAMVILMLASGGMLVVMVARYRRFSNEVEELANKDSLTSLPNRRGFFKLFEERLEKSRARHGSLVVGVIDLDGFKAVNDIFGHGAGDQLLFQTGKRLVDVLGDAAVIGRMGGDEYGLVLTGVRDEDEIMQIGRRICAALAEPFEVREGVARVTGSIGFAISKTSHQTATTLYEHADYALYHSKNNSRGEPVLFSIEHETEIRNASSVEQKLLEAEDDEFYIEFQPIIDAGQVEVVGMEALARWTNPSLGRVRPDIFINAAEQTGVVTRLTAVLLGKALKAARDWPEDVYLSFNLSALDLASPESALRLLKIIVDSGFPPSRLYFEITETAVMQDFDRSMQGLDLLIKSGVRIALDDFGTGYSSLGYLQRMPIDRLKIDRSFTEGLETKKATRDIMRSVISLCENLGIDCVVEGIEDRSQVEILQDMGARYIQGYYFAEPMNQQQTLEFLCDDHVETLGEWVAVA